jgi:hypothetical protein
VNTRALRLDRGCLDGKTELRGGSDQDRAEAKEWMSLFWHEAVVGSPASPGHSMNSFRM